MIRVSLVLSLFPGIGLLDRAFEEEGFCVVRGPDLLWGGDIKTFHPPAGVFDGVIGGPPCQAFSRLVNIIRANGYEPRYGNLIPEFERCVIEAQPAWFLMENVPRAPEPLVDGYYRDMVLLDNNWLGEQQRRLRKFTFGTSDDRRLRIETAALHPIDVEPAVCSDSRARPVKIGGSGKPKRVLPHSPGGRLRTVGEMLELQGFPSDLLDDAPFTMSAKRQIVANGVPLPMGRAIAKAVRRALEEQAA